LKGIELAARALPRAVADGTDLNARRDMAMSALISGIALTNAGLGAVHGFAAPLGANFAAPHGAICAALLAPVLRANIAALQSADAHHPLLAKYAIIGRLLSGHADLPAADALLACAQAAGELTARLGIRPLSAYGLAEADVPTMVALAQKASSMRFNPVVLPAEVLQQVLREGIAGM
jgi:alcohol dehydrogenase class IV